LGYIHALAEKNAKVSRSSGRGRGERLRGGEQSRGKYDSSPWVL